MPAVSRAATSRCGSSGRRANRPNPPILKSWRRCDGRYGPHRGRHPGAPARRDRLWRRPVAAARQAEPRACRVRTGPCRLLGRRRPVGAVRARPARTKRPHRDGRGQRQPVRRRDRQPGPPGAGRRPRNPHQLPDGNRPRKAARMLKLVKIGAVALAGPAGAAVAEPTLLPGSDAAWDGTGTPRRTLPDAPATSQATSQARSQAGSETGPADALPELLAAIAAEHDALAARAAELDLRAAEIDLARAAVMSQNQQLAALRDELSRLLEQARGDHNADITRLVKIYEAMKPAEAAAIMQEADLELAVLVISAMPERSSGPIMATMDPMRANAISRVILDRSRLPGDRAPVIVRLD